jgi:uncharacterized membrane protein
MSSNRLQFTPGVWVALAVTLLLWASAYAGIRAGLRGYSPADLATLRFIVASVALGIYALLAHFRRPALRDLPGLILAGIVGITFYNIALNYGETRVTAGSASMLIASAPIWTTLLAVFFLHEHLSSLGWIGILLSFVGVALIASGEGGRNSSFTAGVHYPGLRCGVGCLHDFAETFSLAIYAVGVHRLLDLGGNVINAALREAPACRTSNRVLGNDAGRYLLRGFPRRDCLLGVGLRLFARTGWTHLDSALPDSGLGYSDCLGLATRSSETCFSGWGRHCTGRRPAGKRSDSAQAVTCN